MMTITVVIIKIIKTIAVSVIEIIKITVNIFVITIQKEVVTKIVLYVRKGQWVHRDQQEQQAQ